MANEYGIKPPASPATVDNALSVAAGGAWVNGSSFDTQDATSGLLALLVLLDFALTNAGSTDGQDYEAIVQWSPDASNWPADGQGTPIFAYANSSAGADLSRSNPRGAVPKYRYGRIQHRNKNSTDNITATTRKSFQHAKDYAA